jgi:hypothetical protein
MNSAVSWLKDRLSEQSTWSGIGVFIASLTFLPHAQEIGALAPTFGVMFVSVMKIMLPDPGK